MQDLVNNNNHPNNNNTTLTARPLGIQGIPWEEDSHHPAVEVSMVPGVKPEIINKYTTLYFYLKLF
jgi:hypothetical protein